MSAPPGTPKAGDTLAGKYKLERVLGEGGMGTVFCAEHLRLKQPVAVKVLNPEMLQHADIVQRFDREARAAATLKSRHVVRVSDVETEGTPYMVMELLQGVDLETVREQRSRLPYQEVVDYVLQACDALGEAHDAGIVHRDLKPANLFLAKQDDDTTLVKVLDFGVSKILSEETKLTAAGAMVGTTLYMSPEQLQGDAVDPRSDIWAIGVILYELLSGDAPWVGPQARVAAAIVTAPPPDIRERVSIPEPLAKAIERMLAKKPSERPSSIVEVASLLAPFAPAGSAGAQAADRIARRSARSISVSRLPVVPSVPGSDPHLAAARTEVAERSTDIAATLPMTPRKSGLRTVLVLGALLGLGTAVGIAVLASRRASPGVVADPAAATTPPPAASSAVLAPPSAAPSLEPPPSVSVATPASASAAPRAGTAAVKPVRAGANAKPAETGAAKPTPPPPRSTNTAPAATNPTFLN